LLDRGEPKRKSFFQQVVHKAMSSTTASMDDTVKLEVADDIKQTAFLMFNTEFCIW